jgi:predicted nucleotidyltransferase
VAKAGVRPPVDRNSRTGLRFRAQSRTQTSHKIVPSYWCSTIAAVVKIKKKETPTLADAQRISNSLRKSFPTIDGIFLYGSVARGDADEWSDIDLIVTGVDKNLTPERLRKALRRRGLDRISIIYYPTPVFRKHYRERALFIAHLKKEGIPLFDRLHLFRSVLARPYRPVVDVSEGIRSHLTKLDSYSDPKRFNNNFLFCLAHIYTIGKGVIMLGLARRGIFEFNREAAFRRFSEMHPDLNKELRRVARLRPFYTLITGRKPEALPFSYRSAARQLRESVVAVRRLADRAESGNG